MIWIKEPEPYDFDKPAWLNRQRHHGTLKCICGAAVDLYPAIKPPDYVAECNNCHTLYNLVGQQLKSRDEWDELDPETWDEGEDADEDNGGPYE